jgi:hypothetical protein
MRSLPCQSLAALVALFLTVGCGKDSTTGPPTSDGEPVPEFSLPDTNPTSSRFEEMVSPRDYRGRISAWYFGYAT